MPFNPVTDLARLKQLCASLSRRARTIQRLPAAQRTMVRQAEDQVNRSGFMEDIIRLRFMRESTRANGGESWPHRQEAGDGHPLLRDTGRLFAAAKRAVKGTFRALGTRFEIERVGVEYGKYHERGTSRLPVRSFMQSPSPYELRPAWKRFRLVITRLLRRSFR